MTPDQVSESLNHLAKIIAENIPDMTQTVALTSVGFIRERIQTTGQDAELVSFPSYSPGYKKYKGKKQGDNATSFRNLTLSGDMWRKTGIKSASSTAEGYTVVIGGTTQQAQDKMNYNFDEAGNFLAVSDEEEKNLTEDYDEMLDKLIAESGLG